MPKMNFTKEQNEIYELTRDLARNEFAIHVDKDKVTRKDLEEFLRNRINNDILKGATLYQAYRRNNVVMFEIIEEVVNLTIDEDVFNSPFVENFVEVKNRALGDTTAFYHEGGMLSVATFAGNHWDTNRQAVDLGDEFTLPKEWCYIHVYDELERFLLGIVTLERLTDKVYKAINRFFRERLYMQFSNIANAVPAAFSASGNNEEAVGNLVDLVMAAGGYANVNIAGTPAALRKLSKYIPDHHIAESQKEAKANTGDIGTWEGHKLLVIPQVVIPGTFQKRLDDTKLYILGGDSKPIKFEIFGDTRTDMDTTGHKNNDMTLDLQVQTKFGMGLVLPEYCGVFTLQ